MSIVDPSVLELLNHAESHYTLVVEASKRGREIVNGALPMIDADESISREDFIEPLLKLIRPSGAVLGIEL